MPVLSCVLSLSPLPSLLPLTAPLTALLRCPHMSDDCHKSALQALQHVALGEGEMQSLVTVLREARTDRGRAAAMQALATRLTLQDKAQHAGREDTRQSRAGGEAIGGEERWCD